MTSSSEPFSCDGCHYSLRSQVRWKQFRDFVFQIKFVLPESRIDFNNFPVATRNKILTAMATNWLSKVVQRMAALRTETHHPSIGSEYTNREKLLSQQELELAKTTEAQAYDENDAFFRLNANIPERPDKGIKSHVEIINSNIVNIDDLIALGGKIPTGKFFICRIISPCLESISIDAVVEDAKGNKAIRLSIYNATPYLRLKLQVGAILAIKNPWVKTTRNEVLILIVDDPSDIIHDVTILNKLNLEWKGEIPAKYCTLKMDASSRDDYKKLGNTEFDKKNYTKARHFYSEGLVKFPNDIDLLSNRSVTFLHLRLFSLALSDAELVLSMQEYHSKAIFRKTKALCALGKYTEAESFITEKINSAKKKQKELENLDKLEELKIHVEKLVYQSETGEFDIMELIENKNQDYLEVAEYTSGIKVTPIEGKGTGVIATKEFSPGELILVNRVFEIEDTNVGPFGKNEITCMDKLTSKIAQRIEDEPEQVENVYNLYAGPNFESGATRKGNIDMKRLKAICFQNRISKEYTSGKKRIGLWILPSFFNHSCVDYNAHRQIFGDMVFIRALTPINKDDEIVMPYANFSSFQEKDLFFQIQSLRCTCRLCQAEKTVGKAVLETIDDIGKEGLRLTTAKEVLLAIQKLEEITGDNKLLNMMHLNLYVRLVKMYQKAADLIGYSAFSMRLYYDVEDINFKLFILKDIYYWLHKGLVLPGVTLEKCETELKKVFTILAGPSNVPKLMKLSPDEVYKIYEEMLN